MKKLICLSLTVISGLAAYPVTVTTSPGNLQADLANASGTDKTLVLQGFIGPDDYETLCSLEGFDCLDMTDLKLTSGTSSPGISPNYKWSESEILPSYSLFASRFKEIRLPSYITEIHDGAFGGSLVEKITLPAGLKSIGAYAFYKAEHLKELSLPESLSKIGVSAFDGCISLKNINLSSTAIRELPERALARTSELENLDLSLISVVGGEALFGSGIKKIELPSVRNIGDFAFASMRDLKSAKIGSGTLIGRGLFMGDSGLTEITGIPADIPDLFAADCPSFNPENAIIDAVKIGDFAFANSLPQKLIFMPGLISIGDGALAGCSGIKEIDAALLAGYTPEVDATAFARLNVGEILLTVDKDCISTWKRHPVWGKFNISGSEVGVNSVIVSPGALSLKLDSEGLIACHPEAAVMIEGYDLNGRLLIHSQSDSGNVRIPLSRIPEGALIVRAIASDGSNAVIKIIR